MTKREFLTEECAGSYDIPITATVLDIETGKRRACSKYDYFWWSEGEGSCDCNRELLFGNKTNTGFCLGCERYVVVEASLGDVRELNDGYPNDVLARAGL